MSGELALLVFMATTPGVISYTLPSLNGAAVTSHSGPNYVPENKRTKRGFWMPNYQYDNNLLISSEMPNDYLKKWIVQEHNRYRRMVPASDMNMLYWSDELAASAQRHADTCDFRHSRGRMNVGENIWAAPYSNYSDAISIWFNEVHDPRCGCNHAYKHCCGHYVQVVWAKTNLVGCGFSRCRDVQGVWGRGHRNVFVCHYNPQGNTVFVTARGQLYAMPAFTWATDTSDRCSNCPSSAPACYQGLCYMPKGYQGMSAAVNGWQETSTTTTTTTTTTTPMPDDAEDVDVEGEEADPAINDEPTEETTEEPTTTQLSTEDNEMIENEFRA